MASDAEAVFVALSSDKSVSQIGDKIQLALKMARRGRGIKIPTELDASPREITQADKNSLRVMVRRFEAATKPAAAAAAAAPLPIHASPPIPLPPQRSSNVKHNVSLGRVYVLVII